MWMIGRKTIRPALGPHSPILQPTEVGPGYKTTPRWDLHNQLVWWGGRVLRGSLYSVWFFLFLCRNFFFWPEKWKFKKIIDWRCRFPLGVKVAGTVTALSDKQTGEYSVELVPVSVEGESSGTNPSPAQDSQVWPGAWTKKVAPRHDLVTTNTVPMPALLAFLVLHTVSWHRPARTRAKG